MPDGVNKKLHIRTGDRGHVSRLHYRGHVSRLITEFSRIDEQDLLNLKRLQKSLEEKVEVLKKLDGEILELIPEDEAETLTSSTALSSLSLLTCWHDLLK